MKATKELVLKTATTNTVESTATLAKFAKGARPMKSMVAVRSFRPKAVTQVASPKTELSVEAR
ncbi:MAG: hypothetical protein ACOVP4_03165 [Bacteriovoracaceae bacterium]